jgi:hypothetical protein
MNTVRVPRVPFVSRNAYTVSTDTSSLDKCGRRVQSLVLSGLGDNPSVQRIASWHIPDGLVFRGFDKGRLAQLLLKGVRSLSKNPHHLLWGQ